MKKGILIGIISGIGFFSILFWLAFLIIAYRNDYLIFVTRMNEDVNTNSLYYKDNDILFYTYDGLSDVDVYDRRLIFNSNKRNMKEVIQNGEFYFMLDELNVYRYNYGGVIESKYTSHDNEFSITKCDFFVDEKILYIFSEKEYKNICRWYK